MSSFEHIADSQEERIRSQFIARALSVVLLLPVGLLVILALITPLTIWGALYLVGTGAVVIGLGSIAWGYAKYSGVAWLGLGLMIAVAAVRLCLLGGSRQIKMISLPDQSARCWLNCLLDEQDVALFSTRALSLVGWISPAEQAGLLEAMTAGYQAMAKEQGLVPSPFVRTYLNRERPDAFDAVVIEPEGNQPVQLSVIFLHGFTGNFTLPCWLFAQAVLPSHGLTVCPSVGWQGDWWTTDSEATLRATIDYLHRRGVSRIYLAGLSNGAVGASELAHKLTQDLAGLILLSGASPDASDSGLPVLVLAGSQDERMPAAMLRAYANRMGTRATFVELQADHFMLAKNHAAVRATIDVWLRSH